MGIELVVLLHADFSGRVCEDTGTEFLKMHAYLVESKTAVAVGTFNARQC